MRTSATTQLTSVGAAAAVGEWADARRALWQRISAYRFGSPRSPGLPARIAHALKRPASECGRSIDEYRRFCFLAVVADHVCTPSAVVDAVWHAHLSDTREYWLHFCRDVLQHDLHHAPSLRGSAEHARHLSQYHATLESYRRYFGDPPSAYWPAPSRVPVDVERQRAQSPWALPPRLAGRAIGVLSAAMAAVVGVALWRQGSANPLHWSGGMFLLFFVTALAWAHAAGAAARRLLCASDARSAPQRAQAIALDAIELACLADGPTRAADTALLTLLEREVLVLDYVGLPADAGRRPELVSVRIDTDALRAQTALADAAPTSSQLDVAAFAATRADADAGASADGVGAAPAWSPRLREAAEIVAGEDSLWAALSALRSHYLALAQPLLDAGLWLSSGRERLARFAGSAPLWLLALLGAAKIVVGVRHGWPVGFLVVLVMLAVIMAAVAQSRRPRRTFLGEWVLHHATRRMPAADAAHAMALIGTTALVGTAHADFHFLRAPPAVSESSDSAGGWTSGSDGSGSGGDGSSDGGSSCGGCGGCGGGGGD